uniref:Uncharacterized protein n=1 Tax=Anguilla anguilla TaxID=7936 RepID=A0A0E9WMT3_ANGAN
MLPVWFLPLNLNHAGSSGSTEWHYLSLVYRSKLGAANFKAEPELCHAGQSHWKQNTIK